MEVVILDDDHEVAAAAASIIRKVVNGSSTAVLGLATGQTPLATYRCLIGDCRQSTISFSGVSTFNLDEYLGLPPGAGQSYRAFMYGEFFSQIDIDSQNTHFPECNPDEDPTGVGPRYEKLIRSKGGIDLQLLGIGRNGHIGFNEPTSSLSSRTRVKTLTRRTLESNKKYFVQPARQPQLAITMGIGTIMDARAIVLLATGEDKAEAVRESVEGPVSSMWPASTLQMHERATILLDRAAASKLVQQDYYEWIQQQKHALLRAER